MFGRNVIPCRACCNCHGLLIKPLVTPSARRLPTQGIALASCTLLREKLASNALQLLDQDRHSIGMGRFLVRNANRTYQTRVGDPVGFLTDAQGHQG